MKKDKIDRKSFLMPRDTHAGWFSIYISCVLSFSAAAQYTLYFSSLWPYLQVIDPTVTEPFYGFVIAMFSAGQIISAPLYGFWSNSLKQVRIPIIAGLIIMLIGNFTYLFLGIVDFPHYLLIVSEFLMGFGSSFTVLSRSYAATALPEKYRTQAISLVTCGQAIGLTTGPLLQMLFTVLFKYPGYDFLFKIKFNLYTAPAFFSLLNCLVGIIAMKWFFVEKSAGIISSASTTTKRHHRLPPYDKCALVVILFTRFSYMFVNTNLGTIAGPYSMMMFVWDEVDTVFYTSLAQGIIGASTVFVYIVMIYYRLDKKANYRFGSAVALVILIIFHLITYSWPFLSEKVTIINEPISDVLKSSSGCNINKFSWCETLRLVHVWVYYPTYVFSLGLAFPILNIGNTTLFSDILGPRRQALEQGFFQMSSGVARLLGPVIISNLYWNYGPNMAWNMEIVVILLTLIIWLAYYSRIVPLIPNTQNSIHTLLASDVAPDLNAPSSGMSSLSGANSPVFETKTPTKPSTGPKNNTVC